MNSYTGVDTSCMGRQTKSTIKVWLTARVLRVTLMEKKWSYKEKTLGKLGNLGKWWYKEVLHDRLDSFSLGLVETHCPPAWTRILLWASHRLDHQQGSSKVDGACASAMRMLGLADSLVVSVIFTPLLFHGNKSNKVWSSWWLGTALLLACGTSFECKRKTKLQSPKPTIPKC